MKGYAMKTSVVSFMPEAKQNERDYTCHCSSNGLSNEVLITVRTDITDDQVFEHFAIRAIGIKLQDMFRDLKPERIAEINTIKAYEVKLSSLVPAERAKKEDVNKLSDSELIDRLGSKRLQELIAKLTETESAAAANMKAFVDAAKAQQSTEPVKIKSNK